MEEKRLQMLKERVKEIKRELVLQKVSELIEAQGYEKLPMNQIAKECGISVGALYKLFGSKDELFYAYVAYQIELFTQKLQEAFNYIEDPKKRIRFFIELKFKTFQEKKAVLQDTIAADPLFFAKLNVTKQNPAEKIYHMLAKEIEKLGVDEPLKHSYLLNGLTLGAIEFWLAEDGRLDPEEIFTLFLQTLRSRR